MRRHAGLFPRRLVKRLPPLTDSQTTLGKGASTEGWELVACDDKLGEFAIDDNEELADPALSRFILEVRDVSIPPCERRFLPNKGWRRTTTKECIVLLESAGVIERNI